MGYYYYKKIDVNLVFLLYNYIYLLITYLYLYLEVPMKKEFVEMPVTDFIYSVVIPCLKKDGLVSYVLIDENFNFLKDYIRKLAIVNEDSKTEIAKSTIKILKKAFFN